MSTLFPSVTKAKVDPAAEPTETCPAAFIAKPPPSG